MSEDYLFMHRHNVGDPTASYNERIYNMALCNLEDRVIMMRGLQITTYDLPTPERRVEETMSRIYSRELNYNREELAVQAEELEGKLTDDQHNFYNSVLEMVDRGDSNITENNIIFLDAPRGTGKS